MAPLLVWQGQLPVQTEREVSPPGIEPLTCYAAGANVRHGDVAVAR
jgi:hypothetical protein